MERIARHRTRARRGIWGDAAFAFACALLVALAGVLCSCSQQSAETALPQRESVNDYTWGELAQLADAISAAGSQEAALKIAVEHNLATPEGGLDGTQAKDLELADGARTKAIIAGFAHDEQQRGQVAGITFALADAVALRGMNNDAGFTDVSEFSSADVIGGWGASDMRTWLNRDFIFDLPADLQAELASVRKVSIAVQEAEAFADGSAYATDDLTVTTEDKLWLPSEAELSGMPESAQKATYSYRSNWVNVLRAEGKQYQLFAEAGIAGDALDENELKVVAGANQVFERTLSDGTPCSWWLRSVEENTFANVREDGSINRLEVSVKADGSMDVDARIIAAQPLGVVPFFAL